MGKKKERGKKREKRTKRTKKRKKNKKEDVTSTVLGGKKFTHLVKMEWERRNDIEEISMSLLEMTEFLNIFEKNIKIRLGKLNKMIYELERKVDFCVLAINPVDIKE